MKSNTLIICESTDNGTDKKLIEVFLKKLTIAPDRYIINPKGSVVEVIKFLKNLHQLREITTGQCEQVLVVVDADEDPNNRFREICEAFNRVKFELPESIGCEITRSTGKVKVGIYLFPDNQDPGSLETLCLSGLIGTECDQKIQCINEYLGCLRTKSIDQNMTINNQSKSKFRIFHATPDPDSYVSTITECIDPNSAAFAKLKSFFSQCFKSQ